MATMLSTCTTQLSSRASAFTGPRVFSASKPFVPCVARSSLTIQAAHKTGTGSSKNNRDSKSKRRGVKVFGGQPVKAGGIIYRQLGSQWYPGDNVGMGKDFTIYSKVAGIVVYEQNKRGPREVHVYPVEHEAAIAEVKKTHTIAPKEGVPNRQQRRRAMYTPRGQQREPAAVGVAAVAAAVAP